MRRLVAGMGWGRIRSEQQAPASVQACRRAGVQNCLGVDTAGTGAGARMNCKRPVVGWMRASREGQRGAATRRGLRMSKSLPERLASGRRQTANGDHGHGHGHGHEATAKYGFEGRRGERQGQQQQR